MINWNFSVKAMPEDAGIYGIMCVPNGRVYVGSSIKLRSRCRDHISRLRAGRHRNRYLQSAWNDFGEKSFMWASIEVCASGENLSVKEMAYIDDMKSAYSLGGFNLELSPRKGGYDRETRALLSKIMLGPSHPHRGKKLSAEVCEKTRTRVRAAGPLAGKFKGVNLDARTQSFMARIYVDGKQIFLGRYKTEVEAAHAYNVAATINFGANCFLNPIECEPILNRRTMRGRPAMEMANAA